MVVTSGEKAKIGREYRRAFPGLQGNLLLDLSARYKGMWLLCENLPTGTFMMYTCMHVYFNL